ncbi:MAG: helix-turn-helix transcriptional regulator [Phycisphaerales bacterium]|nr:helix-turn-helix transcriptional regulator [Phycisphaerales bacterium]
MVRCLGLDLPRGFRIAEHEHAWPQLVYASSGVLTVRAGSGVWVVPSQRAVWMPAGFGHAVECAAAASMRTLYFHPDLDAGSHDRPRVVAVSELLRQVVLRTMELGGLRRDDGPQRRLAFVALDELATTREAPLRLPMPADPRASRLAQALLASPGDTRTLEALAAGSGASSRTLARLFSEQTGMAFGRWRTRARLIAALQRLAQGEPVSLVASHVGYERVSAFIAMFKRELGQTPGRYFDGAGAGDGEADESGRP